MGAKRTSPADHTSPAAPIWAIQPAAAAAMVDTDHSGTTAIPAICATPINGIARKLSPRPAKVIREKIHAPIGNNSASAASEAANIGHRYRRMTTIDAELAE